MWPLSNDFLRGEGKAGQRKGQKSIIWRGKKNTKTQNKMNEASQGPESDLSGTLCVCQSPRKAHLLFASAYF